MDMIHFAVGMYNAASVITKEFSKLNLGSEAKKAERRSLILPLVVVCAFGIELALKAVIRRQGEASPKTHDLYELFGLLSPENKKFVREMTINIKKDVDVDRTMKVYRNAFQEWRYPDSSRDPLLVDPDLLKLILAVVISLHSEKYGEDLELDLNKVDSQPGVPLRIQKKVEEYKKEMGIDS